jgi:hypothetical protein
MIKRILVSKVVSVGVLLSGCSILAFSLGVQLNKNGSHEIDEESKKEILKVLDTYMATFNGRNLKGWEDTYHFPHYRLASGKMSSLNKAGLRDSSKVFGALAKSGWHHSVWEHRNIIQTSVDKVHVDTQFSRYRKDGSKIGVYESLYIMPKKTV